MLPKADFALPVLGFGCGIRAGLMTGPRRREQDEAIALAFANGITFFDTAPGYGDGTSESNLGAALADLGVRGTRAQVSTKVRLKHSQLGSIKDSIVESVRESCARLSRPTLDFVFLHNRVDTDIDKVHLDERVTKLTIDDLTKPEGVLDAFLSLKREGLVRFTGFTTLECDPAAALQAINTGAFDAINAAVNQTVFSDPVQRDVLEKLLAGCSAHNMGVIAIRVLAPALDSLTANEDGAVDARNIDSAVLGAIRFAIGVEGVVSAVLGFSNARQIQHAVDALGNG